MTLDTNIYINNNPPSKVDGWKNNNISVMDLKLTISVRISVKIAY